MHSISVNSPKGPALLAKAGVSLADATWFYRNARAGATMDDAARMDEIRRKVGAFLGR